MASFKDNAGRNWTVHIDVGAVKAVRDVLDVDLMDVVEGKLLEQLATDPVLLVDVLYVLCRDQADSQNVSDVDFGRAIAGDVIDMAVDAFLEALVGFFPSRRRQLLAKARDKYRTLETMVLDEAERRLDSDELESRLRREMSGDWPSSAPESSASSPTG